MTQVEYAKALLEGKKCENCVFYDAWENGHNGDFEESCKHPKRVAAFFPKERVCEYWERSSIAIGTMFVSMEGAKTALKMKTERGWSVIRTGDYLTSEKSWYMVTKNEDKW
jgi:hypothetical protein